MSITSSAGTVLSITAAIPDTFDIAGYDASAVRSSFLPIGEITDAGAHGRTYAEVTHHSMSGGLQKYKGSHDDGEKVLGLALDSDDAGQALLKTALDSDNNYSFRVAYPDGRDLDYFQAKCMSFKTAAEGADSIASATCSISIDASNAGVGVIEVIGGELLLEDGGSLLLEDGGHLLIAR